MFEVYRKVLTLFDARERRRFSWVMVIMIGVALAELVSMSAVLMLLSVLAQPDRITTNPILQGLYQGLGFTSTYSFQLLLAGLTFIAVMGSLVLRAAGNYVIYRFSAMRSYSLSRRLLTAYLHRSYSWFLTQNSADMTRTVLQEADQIVQQVVVPGLRLASNGLVVLVIVGFLLVIDPLIMILTAVLLGGCYAGIYLRLQSRLRRLGQDMMTASGERFRLTQEAAGGFKEVKLLALEDAYVHRFDGSARRHASYVSRLQLLGELPRFFLEGLTFAILLSLVMLLLIRNDGDLVAAIPTLGTFAFAAMRLLPALQGIYHGFASIRSGTAVLDKVFDEHSETFAIVDAVQHRQDDSPALALTRDLELRGVEYAYEGGTKAAVHNLDMRIAARTTIGIVGGTGAGKTTLVDLILGLLSPQKGAILVDGVPIDPQNVRAWQKTLGYVPQQIYLSDDTVACNIAFGVPPAQIDMAAVERAARIAALHDFVMSDLPKGYDTLVGERGVRLSGGQRQRIGIARALYTNPSLLIMDEATSALDTITERVVMEAVQNIRRDKTIIMIAHRLSTVRNCDQIFLLEGGRIAAAGAYDELVANNDTFQRMVAG